MAYLKKYKIKNTNIEIQAYYRIDTTRSANGKCEASLNIYESREAWLNGEGYLEQLYPVEYSIQYGEDVGSDKDQGYKYLMSLDENKDAISVFEEGQPL